VVLKTKRAEVGGNSGGRRFVGLNKFELLSCEAVLRDITFSVYDSTYIGLRTP
jgi:hypothetical protein